MSKWTHAICTDCWEEQNGDRTPVTTKGLGMEICCFCGEKTSAGIYTRKDPEKTKCRGTRWMHAAAE